MTDFLANEFDSIAKGLKKIEEEKKAERAKPDPDAPAASTVDQMYVQFGINSHAFCTDDLYVG